MTAENLMYFKTIIINLWAIFLVIISCAVYFYNIRRSSMVASGTNTFAAVTFPLLIIPGIVDHIIDIATLMEPDKLKGGGMIAAMIAMCFVAIFGILYAVSYQRIMTQCVELSCFEGYIPLTDDDDFEEDDDPTYENIDQMSQIKSLGRTDWFAIINLHLISNVIWGFVSYNLILALIYIMRVWCIFDTNINRGTDIGAASGIAALFLIILIVYDWFVFRVYSFPIFVHYITFVAFAISLMMEFHKAVGLEEAFSFALLLISSSALVVKIIAGIRFREMRYKKMV